LYLPGARSELILMETTDSVFNNIFTEQTYRELGEAIDDLRAKCRRRVGTWSVETGWTQGFSDEGT
jgi:hypothetical protein